MFSVNVYKGSQYTGTFDVSPLGFRSNNGKPDFSSTVTINGTPRTIIITDQRLHKGTLFIQYSCAGVTYTITGDYRGISFSGKDEVAKYIRNNYQATLLHFVRETR